MSGDESSRFCTYCKKPVHNLEVMTVSERLALLSSPAASICARYRIAIRRPAKGKEESYMRHMMKYGAGVAVSGSVLLVLWQVRSECEQRTFYRAVAGMHRALTDPDWPEEFYDEHVSVTLGVMLPSSPSSCELPASVGDPTVAPLHVDLDLDPVEIDKLLLQIEPTAPRLKPVVSQQPN